MLWTGKPLAERLDKKRTIQANNGIRQELYVNELNLQLPGCDKCVR